MAVLYSKISPTIFGYEASVEASNQQFVMITVANSAIDLAASSQGSQTRVKIVSQNAVYSLSNGYTLDLSLTDAGSPIASHSTQLGSFNGNITSSYHQDRGTFYYGRVSSESSFITTNTTEATNFVSKGVFLDTEIDFSLFFKTRMEITEHAGIYDITFITIKLVVLQNNYDFPINLEEWTLRMVRQATTITEFQSIPITGQLLLQQTLSGTTLNPIDLSALSGHTVNIKFIEVPIQFGL